MRRRAGDGGRAHRADGRRVIPGVGPVTLERLDRIGVRTVADLREVEPDELVRVVGKAHGEGLAGLARARDDRPVEAEREAKSISTEDTFATDVKDRAELAGILRRHARQVAARLTAAQLFARTVTIKVRRPDFSTLTRARTLVGATDRVDVIASVAAALLDALDITGGVRLLGVGVTGLTDLLQEDLFADDAPDGRRPSRASPGRRRPSVEPDERDRGARVRPGAARLGAGARRGARRARARVGLGCGRRPGHGAVRDAGTPRRARCGRSRTTTPPCACARSADPSGPQRRQEDVVDDRDEEGAPGRLARGVEAVARHRGDDLREQRDLRADRSGRARPGRPRGRAAPRRPARRARSRSPGPRRPAGPSPGPPRRARRAPPGAARARRARASRSPRAGRRATIPRRAGSRPPGGGPPRRPRPGRGPPSWASGGTAWSWPARPRARRRRG